MDPLYFPMSSTTSLLLNEKRQISKLKRTVTQLDGKLAEITRLNKFQPAVVQEELEKWNEIIFEIVQELKSLLQQDQFNELTTYLIQYCKSRALPHLITQLALDEEEEEEEEEATSE